MCAFRIKRTPTKLFGWAIAVLFTATFANFPVFDILTPAPGVSGMCMVQMNGSCGMKDCQCDNCPYCRMNRLIQEKRTTGCTCNLEKNKAPQPRVAVPSLSQFLNPTGIVSSEIALLTIAYIQQPPASLTAERELPIKPP